MLLNCGVGEDSWESLGLQGDPTSPSWRKSVLNIHCKDWCWSWNSNTLATWYEELTHWKRHWCLERLKTGGKGDDGWDGWHHQLDGHEFEQALGVGDGQGGLACCSSWGHKELDTTECPMSSVQCPVVQLDVTELNWKPLTVWITTNCGKLLKRWNTRPHYLSPENPVCGSRSKSQNQNWNNGLVPNWERGMTRMYIVTLLI